MLRSFNVICYTLVIHLIHVKSNPDLQVTDFIPVGSTAVLIPDKVVVFPFAVKVTNGAASGSANNINSVSSPSKNFAFKVYFSDTNTKTGTNSLTSIPQVTPSMITPSDLQKPIPAGSFISLTGEASITLPMAHCSSAQFLCITVSVGTGAAYTDADSTPASNSYCVNVNAWKVCAPDPAITYFNDGGVFYKPDSPISLSYKMTIRNEAKGGTTGGNDIPAVSSPKSNFRIQLQFSNIDMQAFTDTLGVAPVTITLSPATDHTRGLPGQTSFNTSGSESMTLTSANCIQTHFVCAILSVPTTGVYKDINDGSWSNIVCVNIDDRKTCKPDPAIDSFLETSGAFVKQNAAFTLSIKFIVKNVASGPTGSGNDIDAVTSPSKNFALSLKLSDADLSTGATDGLTSLVAVTPTITADLSQGLLATTGSLNSNGKASFTVGTECPNVKYLCLILKEGTGAVYADADTSNNIKCIDVSSQKTCAPNPEIAAFSETSGTVFKGGSPTTSGFQVVVKNAATGSGNDILAVTAGKVNYGFELYVSNADMESAADTLGEAAIPASVTADLKQGLLAGNSFSPWTGTAPVSLPSGVKCPTAKYLCVKLTIPSSASFTDGDTTDSSNMKCASLTGRTSCEPNPEITDFKETGTSAISPGSSLSFSITVKNVAAVADGNDIYAVLSPNKNFDFKLQLSDVDMRTSTDTLSSPLSSATIVTEDVGRGLSAQKSFTTSGTATASFTSLSCPKVKFLCVTMAPGAGASYPDADTKATSNVFCHDVSARIVCSPDPAILSFSGQAGLKLPQDVATTVTLTINAKNEAAVGHNIIDVSGSDQNFKFELHVSNVDISAGQTNTLGVAAITVSVQPPSDLQAGIDAGQTKTLTGTAPITITAAKCPDAKFLCLLLSEGTGASYIDADKTNNVKCLDLLLFKQCATDLEALNFLEPGNMIMYQGKASNLAFSTLFTTKGPDAIGTASGSLNNFDVTIKLSNVDIKTAGVGANTVTTAEFSTTINPDSDRQKALSVGGALTLKGSAAINIPQSVCSSVKFLCIHVVTSSTAPFSDPTDANNWICKDVTTQVRCFTDPTITSIVDTAASVFHQDVAVTLNLGLKLKNDVTVAAGNDILAVSDPNKNFVFSFQFSNDDMSMGGTNSLGAAAVTPTVSSNILKQELKAGVEINVPASASMTLTGMKCADAAYFCVKVEKGTGASYIDGDPSNNIRCLDITGRKSCRPDTAVINFREPANAALLQDVDTDLTIQIDVQNKGTASSGNDISPVTGTKANFAFEFIFSDRDLAFGPSTLGIPSFTPTMTSDLKQGLQVGPASMTTFIGTVKVKLTKDKCKYVRFLCVILREGTGASFVDATYTNNQNCKDIRWQKGCNADPAPVDFDTVPTTAGLIEGKAVTLTFKVKIENVAIGKASVINAVTGASKNFEVVLKLSNRDLGIGSTDTLQIDDIVTTISPATDLQKAVLTGPTNAIEMTGTAVVTIPSSKCAFVGYLCVHIKEGMGSSYSDGNILNNFRCKRIENQKSCKPDLEIESLTEIDGPSTFLEDTKARFRFTMRLTNTAENLSGNRILAAIAPNLNYDVKAYLSDGDVGVKDGSNTIALPLPAIQVASASELSAQLLVGDFSFIRGETSVTIAKADCPDTRARFICFDIKPHLTAAWKDVNLDYKNSKCHSIETQKKCKPEFLNLPQTVTVKETQTASISLHPIQINDGNSRDIHIYAYTSAQSPVPVYIDSSGHVLLKSNPGLDYEGGPRQYVLNITVNDGYFTISETLTIDVLEEPEYPYYVNLPKALVLHEHHVDLVYDVQAKDEDVGDKVTYKMTSIKPYGPFQFDANKHELFLPAAPSLNYELQTFYRIYFEIKDKSGHTVHSYLNITVTDVEEAPNITNLPDVRSVREDETVGRHIFRIEAWDPENHNITYRLNPTPSDGNFILKPPGGPDVYTVAHPKFDRETTPTYLLNVTATDGVLFSAIKILTVTVLDVNEPPYLTRLPATTAVAENAPPNKGIYPNVGAKDPENKAMTFKVISSPPSGNALFKVSPTGRVQVTQTPTTLDYETQKVYNLSIQACDSQFCSEPGFLVVDVTDANEPPRFNPKSGNAYLKEHTPLESNLNITLTYEDPDVWDTASFTALPSTYSGYFFVVPSTGEIKVAKDFDYETMPHSVSFDILIQDSGGNEDTFHLTVNILNDNDHFPIFTQGFYDFGKLLENSVGGTGVGTVSASDGDDGQLGNIEYVIDDEPAKSYFQVNKLPSGAGYITVKHPIDREKFSVLDFKVYAVDGGGARVPTNVRVTIVDQNDNRPTFTKSFHNFEIRDDATAGTIIGEVFANDADATGKAITYSLAPGKGNAEDFSMLFNRGILAVKNPLTTGRTYEVYAVAKDSGTPEDTSIATLMRVDAFDPMLYLLDMEVSGTPASFTDAKKKTFIDKMKTLCEPCVPRIAEVTASSDSESKSLLKVYFLRNGKTETGDLSVTKEFMGVDEVLQTMTRDSEGRPTEEVTLATEADFPMYSIKRSIPAPEAPQPSWIETLEGQITVGVLALAGLAAIMIGGFLLAKHCSKKIATLSSGRKNAWGQKPDMKGKWDSRYARKPHSKPTDTRVHNVDEYRQAWRKDMRRAPVSKDKRPKMEPRSATSVSQVSAGQVDLGFHSSNASRGVRGPSVRVSDQSKY